MKMRKENRLGGGGGLNINMYIQSILKIRNVKSPVRYIYVNIKDNVTENTVRNMLFSILL